MYVDGSTGSMIASAVVAGAAGIGVVGSAVWRKVKSPLRRNNDADTVEATDTTAEQQ